MVGKKLALVDNGNLESLSGLALDSVGDISIGLNSRLSDISALGSLRSLGMLNVWGNTALDSIAGIDPAMVRWQGRTFKEYRGMGSLKAMRKGSGDRYGQNSSGKLVAEGVEARVPYKGMLADVVFQLMGGLRSGMGYLGAHSLTELRDKARFVQITSGGLKESHAHDITITEEPINYSC